MVGGISRQDPAKVRLTEHDDMIEALTTDELIATSIGVARPAPGGAFVCSTPIHGER
jgi:hypothetical protein